MRFYLNDNWQFFPEWSDSVFEPTSQGSAVRLPHTNAETPFNCFDESIYQFVSGYKRTFTVSKQAGATYLLTFEGIAHQADVFVNGRLAVQNRCGYNAFTANVTDCVTDGENVLVVKVDSRESLNQPPFGFVMDYMTYGGIYREAYLDEYVGAYISDAFVRADISGEVKADVTLAAFAEPVSVKWSIEGDDGTVTCGSQQANGEKLNLIVKTELKPWSVDEPNLYTLTLKVCGNVHKYTFGARTAKFMPDGFYLNGQKLKIVGLNRHQSYPYVGYAMPDSMQKLDAKILKDMGLNAVRTSHYMQAQSFVDECDRLGLLVFTEIPGWQHIGDDEWQSQTLDNVRSMVLQYRNHPSIVLWGVRINESVDCDELYAKTNAVAHALDETRQTGGVRYLAQSNLLEDVYTFNDFNALGATDRNKVCKKGVPYLVTEYNGHMFPTKSFDDFPHVRTHVKRYAQMVSDIFAASGTAGSFGWCLFDYNTHRDFGSGDRICYHGVTDMFRNPKPAAFVFRSLGKSNYFVKAAFTTDIGDYPEGNVGEMFVLTNAECIDVYRGGSFVKRYTHANSPYGMPNAPILVDDLIGERLTTEDGIKPSHAKVIKKCLADVKKYGLNKLPLGTKLKIAYVMAAEKLSRQRVVELYGKYESNWGGKANDVTIKAYVGETLVAEQTVGSTDAVHLSVEPSHTELTERSTYDVACVQIRMLDQNGNVCPYVQKVVNLRTEGVIELIGPSQIALQGGMFGTYVKTVGKCGSGTLYLDDQKVEFTVSCLSQESQTSQAVEPVQSEPQAMQPALPTVAQPATDAIQPIVNGELTALPDYAPQKAVVVQEGDSDEE